MLAQILQLKGVTINQTKKGVSNDTSKMEATAQFNDRL